MNTGNDEYEYLMNLYITNLYCIKTMSYVIQKVFAGGWPSWGKGQRKKWINQASKVIHKRCTE